MGANWRSIGKCLASGTGTERIIQPDYDLPGLAFVRAGKHRIILLETDATTRTGPSPASGSPALSDIQARYVYCPQDTGEVQKRLVLIDPDDRDRPRGTARWQPAADC
jgi:hypothetical protein